MSTRSFIQHSMKKCSLNSKSIQGINPCAQETSVLTLLCLLTRLLPCYLGISHALRACYLFSRVRLFCDPMDCGPLGSSVHGILQARMLEWVAMSFSRGPSPTRDRTCISYTSCMADGFLTTKGSHPGSPPNTLSYLCTLVYTLPSAWNASFPLFSPKALNWERKIKMGSALLRELSKTELRRHGGYATYTHLSQEGI